MISALGMDRIRRKERSMTDVLVVGAGPVGLIMAVALARHSARCRTIDELAAPPPVTARRSA